MTENRHPLSGLNVIRILLSESYFAHPATVRHCHFIHHLRVCIFFEWLYLDVFLYVCMYVCMHGCPRVCPLNIYVSAYLYVCMCTCVYDCMCACVCVWGEVHVDVCLNVCPSTPIKSFKKEWPCISIMIQSNMMYYTCSKGNLRLFWKNVILKFFQVVG